MAQAVQEPKFLGLLPLWYSVAIGFVSCVLRCFALLYIVCFYNNITFAGVHFYAEIQCAVASLGLLGPPLSILAGFGTLFGVSAHVKTFSLYLKALAIVDCVIFLALLLAAGLCEELAHDVLIVRSPAFVCLFVHIGFFFWGIVGVALDMYLAMAVGQKAEAILRLEKIREPWKFPLSQA
mmetsp:Transcript_5529/g.7814  ORF Transcript_5529/g.7814 Transcript_5529/m.7814 type:complete len:180 (-) Transcript_5529:78-617(-)|eukprot:CAMPEP_0194753682 /NCGR_PEP_ID=MMETSP0323_2-20130528/7661_1 /TAXON_ID=2866 ORGANISM="Crypthecodinium cohnii, Strain Seligo" /NCGR_SAMPLE_ID=MMETSP0323_2 /ASSEMBLY_ACC=CAM_ASM_000346 /LENGTH=179 /DNA_ID=CAMNT_0039671709 /DNA_START=99 /DNA_END=638 /DNA_ORIENTATION=+